MEKTNLALRIIFTIQALVVFLASLVFAFLSSAPVSFSDGGNVTRNLAPALFTRSVEGLDSKYPSDISPADWVFVVIWPLVYFWNLVGIMYLMASLCLPQERSPVLRDPPLMPIPSLIFWSLLWGGSFAWLFVYDRELIGLGLAILIISAWSGYLCLAFSYRSYAHDIMFLEEHESKTLWLVRILIHNGFAVVTTWLTCAWKVNLATVIAYVDGRETDQIPAALRSSLTAEDAGTISLSILLLEFVVWFILENFVFERHCRYTVSIYPTLIFVFVGIFVGKANELNDSAAVWQRNQVISLAGLILSCIAFVARVFLVILRHRNRSLLA